MPPISICRDEVLHRDRYAVSTEPAALSREPATPAKMDLNIVMPAADAERIWLTLIEHGAKYGVVPAGLGCRDTLRLESAMPLYGHELNETVDPLTAGLEFAVKFNKPDYPGKAALEFDQEPWS